MFYLGDFDRQLDYVSMHESATTGMAKQQSRIAAKRAEWRQALNASRKAPPAVAQGARQGWSRSIAQTV